MAQLEVRRIVIRLDIGPLGLHRGSELRTLEHVEQRRSAKPQRFTQRQRLTDSGDRRPEREVGDQFHGGAGAQAADVYH